MLANKIISVVIAVTGFIVVPIQLITTFILGLLVKITFGFLLIPFSIIWIILFLGPLLGLSFVYERVYILRIISAIIGIPIAVLGDTYVALLPSMGEMESRYSKMILCQTFPYTFRYLQFSKGKFLLEKDDILFTIFVEVSKAKPLGNYLENIIQQKQSYS
jgi:hypothetical protein